MKYHERKGALAALLMSIISAPCLAAGPSFHWISSPPLMSPPKDGTQVYYGVKDPSVVQWGGKYHVFMTVAGEKGWELAYSSFADWSDAPSAPIIPLDQSPMGSGYRAAPEVFYFAPQKLWYLVYQAGDPMYSTSNDIGDPSSWSAPKPFFNAAPDIVKQPSGNAAWLDFWVICDDKTCYLFFTDDHGAFFRAETSLDQFPAGFHNTRLVLKGDAPQDVFEASNTYKVAGSNVFITLIEAIGPKGRYFRIWKSDRLDGEWAPVGEHMNVFAGADNVRFPGGTWSEGVSHGEMIRAGIDQTLAIDPCKPLKFLYQGLDPDAKVADYIKLPYRLGIITTDSENPVSELCVRQKP